MTDQHVPLTEDEKKALVEREKVRMGDPGYHARVTFADRLEAVVTRRPVLRLPQPEPRSPADTMTDHAPLTDELGSGEGVGDSFLAVPTKEGTSPPMVGDVLVLAVDGEVIPPTGWTVTEAGDRTVLYRQVTDRAFQWPVVSLPKRGRFRWVMSRGRWPDA